MWQFVSKEPTVDELVDEFEPLEDTASKKSVKSDTVTTTELQISESNKTALIEDPLKKEAFANTAAQIKIFLTKMNQKTPSPIVPLEATTEPDITEVDTANSSTNSETQHDNTNQSVDLTASETNENETSVSLESPSETASQTEDEIEASRQSLDLSVLTSSLQEEPQQPKPPKPFYMKLFSCLCPCVEDDKTEEFIRSSKQYWNGPK